MAKYTYTIGDKARLVPSGYDHKKKRGEQEWTPVEVIRLYSERGYGGGVSRRVAYRYLEPEAQGRDSYCRLASNAIIPESVYQEEVKPDLKRRQEAGEARREEAEAWAATRWETYAKDVLAIIERTWHFQVGPHTREEVATYLRTWLTDRREATYILEERRKYSRPLTLLGLDAEESSA